MWTLFNKERRDAEAKATMAALDATVNGDEPKPDDSSKVVRVQVTCTRCKTVLIPDPVQGGRMIDPQCKYAVQVYLDSPKS